VRLAIWYFQGSSLALLPGVAVTSL